MTEEHRSADSGLENPSVRHERSDASFGWVLGLSVVALCLGVVILAVVWSFFYRYRDYQAALKRSPYPLAPAPREVLPPTPRLEQLDRLKGTETSDGRERQTSKEEILNRYGSTTDGDFIHIPISQAMRLLENKLPVRKQPPAGERRRDNGLIDAGESNSGRMFRGEPQWDEN